MLGFARGQAHPLEALQFPFGSEDFCFRQADVYLGQPALLFGPVFGADVLQLGPCPRQQLSVVCHVLTRLFQ